MPCQRCSGQMVRGSCFSCGWEPVEITAEPIVAQAPHVGWSRAEEAFLLSTQTTLTGREQARELTTRFGVPRSWKAVKHWYARRGISKPAVRGERTRAPRQDLGGCPGRPWAPAEVEALEDGDVRILSHRSRAAIVNRAYRLGIALRSSDGCLSLRQVASMHRVHPQIIHRLIKRGVLPAHRNGRLWRIEPHDADALGVYLRRRPHWAEKKTPTPSSPAGKEQPRGQRSYPL